MSHGVFRVPEPRNEPPLTYGPGRPEREKLQLKLQRMRSEAFDIPLIIGGEEVRTGDTSPLTLPHAHREQLGVYHKAGPEEVRMAIDAATAAREDWLRTPWHERAAVLLRAAELLATTWRDRLNAATMLGQSKTAHQAEIDSACELIDFWRYNPQYAARLYEEQPRSAPGVWNRAEYRPLDGFVFAVTPFNFTCIAGNLPTAPALMGNTVVWKPASTSVLSNYLIARLLKEAGLPPGVVNFLPGSGSTIGPIVLEDPRLGGVHFTGSTDTFRSLWQTVGANIGRYKQYPRLVGETGGKDFVIAHPSADVDALMTGLIRGAFEYQGQKCSAVSRAYLPRSRWDDLRDRLAAEIMDIEVGDVADFRNFMGAVIDAEAFAKHQSAIEGAREAGQAACLLLGGECDDSHGYFVRPTVIQADDPTYDTMHRELFGPILTVHVYEDARYSEALELCANGSDYGLTGAVFATDRPAIGEAHEALRFAAGNFYVNDKPTGAIVGQQPFGGSRASGTNDKAGSALNLLRWVSPRTIKETFSPPTDWQYPHQLVD